MVLAPISARSTRTSDMFFKGESRDVVLNYPRLERGSGRIWELDFLRGLMIILMISTPRTQTKTTTKRRFP